MTTRSEARKVDDVFYADYDDDTALWCVFGNQSGFAYKAFASEKEAHNHANDMMYWKTRK